MKAFWSAEDIVIITAKVKLLNDYKQSLLGFFNIPTAHAASNEQSPHVYAKDPSPPPDPAKSAAIKKIIRIQIGPKRFETSVTKF